MNTKEDSAEALEARLRDLIAVHKPRTVADLVHLAEAQLTITEDKAVRCILRMQGEGRLALKKPLKPTPERLRTYFRTSALWFWVVVALASATVASVFAIREDATPFVYLRYVLGTIFIVWLPGYSLTRALFPIAPGSKAPHTQKSLDSLERVALSIGMSLALVPMIGLLLNYTPLGIRMTPVLLTLLALTLVFALTGVVREHSQSLSHSTV